MPAPRRSPWFNEFTVLGAFVAVALFGIGYGAIMATGALRAITPDAAAGPSSGAFRAALAEAAGPLLSQAAKSGEAMFAGDTTLAESFVTTTRDQVLAVDDAIRVPATDAHDYLALVLLLDRWTRGFAEGASAAAQASVVADTREYVLLRPWLVADLP
jgi:hypothetical protein